MSRKLGSIATVAEKLGFNKNTVAGYENGLSIPDIDYLAAFADLSGYDLVALLRVRLAESRYESTRQAGLHLTDRLQMRPEPVPLGFADLERLQATVEAVETGLATIHHEMPPDKKAELYMAVYDLLGETPALSKELMLKLIRLAA